MTIFLHYLHYAVKKRPLVESWAEQPVRVLVRGWGPGPRNILVETMDGRRVVVPARNVRRLPL